MLRSLAKLMLGTLRTLDHRVDTPFDDRPRGVALILALVTIVILSTAVVEFAYSSRVNTAMATNESDNLKSYYLAKSGVNLSRLMLSFQYALQDESRDTDDEMGQMIGRSMRRSNFQLYQYVDLLMGPFNSGAVEIPLASVDLEGMGVGGFGEFTGQFEVDVEPEEGRINVNEFARDEVDETHLVELCSMLFDSRYDRLFEEQDQFGEMMDRAAVMANIIDFIDFNHERTLLGNECEFRGGGGDEGRLYARDDSHDVEPRNSRLTHLEEMHRIHGVGEDFMRVFGDSLTVYDVGRPNLNVAGAPVFYSVLCRNIEIDGERVEDGFNPCSEERQISEQVMLLAMALEGIRHFFDDPLSVMLAYVGTAESTLLPSAKMGQPTAFLSVSQLPAFIEDLTEHQDAPMLMARFLPHSPSYQELMREDPNRGMDPSTMQMPSWSVQFNRSGLMRSVTTRTPRVFRITSTGAYGNSNTTIEAVVDYNKSMRRLPHEEQLIEEASQQMESEEMELGDDEEPVDPREEIRDLLRQEREDMPDGRVLYWRVD